MRSTTNSTSDRSQISRGSCNSYTRINYRTGSSKSYTRINDRASSSKRNRYGCCVCSSCRIGGSIRDGYSSCASAGCGTSRYGTCHSSSCSRACGTASRCNCNWFNNSDIISNSFNYNDRHSYSLCGRSGASGS